MKKFFQSKGFIVSSLALLCVTILGVCWFVSRDRTGDFRPDESPPSSVTGDWSDGGTQTDGDNGADAYAPGQSTDAEEEYPKVTSQTEDEVVIDFTDTKSLKKRLLRCRKVRPKSKILVRSIPSIPTRQFRRSLPRPPSKRRPAMSRFQAPATEMELYMIRCLAGLFPAMYSSPQVTAMEI